MRRCMISFRYGSFFNTLGSIFLVLIEILIFRTVLFGKSIRYAGHAESFDDVIIQVPFYLYS